MLGAASPAIEAAAVAAVTASMLSFPELLEDDRDLNLDTRDRSSSSSLRYDNNGRHRPKTIMMTVEISDGDSKTAAG